jgi:gliding motility-associated-like protein
MLRILSVFSFLILSAVLLRADNYPQQGFIPNAGQWDAQVKFKLSIPGGSMFVRNTGLSYVLYDKEAVIQMHEMSHEGQQAATNANITHQGIHMDLLGAMTPGTPILENGSETLYNYYLGNNPSNWAGGLKSWQQVIMPGIYNGINWKLKKTASGVKYDFILDANANPNLIKMDFRGSQQVEIRNNTLYVSTIFGDIVEQAPIAWQDSEEGRISVNVSFVKHADGSIGFILGEYNHNLPLTIDPDLVFATYSGSVDDNWGFTATYDNLGNAYSGGIVFGANFQTTEGVFQESWGGGQIDIGILKYSPDGANALYITYIGGNSVEFPHSMIVNEYDELIVFGTTGSSDFPVTSGAYSSNFQGGISTNVVNIPVPAGLDIFVLRLSSDGSNLQASTFVGGTSNDGFNSSPALIKNYADEIRGALWVDTDNNVYVGTSTSSEDFPTSANAFQPDFGGGGQDGVIIKLNGNLSQLLWSTYLGGASPDGIFYLVVDEEQRVIVTGGTASNGFPVSPNAAQSTYGGGSTDGFVSIVDSSGVNLLASTFVGSNSYDQSFIVGADKTDNVYIFAQTSHTGNQFNINSPIGVTGGNQFLMKYNPDLSEIIWSSPFGNATGQPDLSPTALLVDFCDKIYCTGWGGAVNSALGTNTFGLPTTPDAYSANTDGSDFYLYVVDDQATEILYGSFLGGTSSADHVDGGTSRFDRKGVIYQSICGGCGGQSDFPFDDPSAVYSSQNNSFNCNNLLAKFDFESPITVSAIATLTQPLGCAPYTAEFSNTSINADVFSWRIEDTEISNSQDFTYTFEEDGVYEVVLIASSSTTCNGADTVSVTVTVVNAIEGSLPDITTCPGVEIELGPDQFDDPYYEFNWFPSTGLSATDVRKPTVSPTESTTYSVEIRVGACIDTLTQTVTITTGSRITLPTLSACALEEITIGPSTEPSPTATYEWQPIDDLSSSTIYNPILDLNESATYTLLVDYGEGCVDTLVQDITAIFDQMDAGPDKNICGGEEVEIGLPDVSGDYTYSWQPTASLNNASLPNPIANVTLSTTYTVLRIPEAGVQACPARDTVVLNIVPRPLALFSLEIFANCLGASTIINNESSDYEEFEWEFSNGATSVELEPNIVISYNDSLLSTFIAINGECRDTFSIEEFIGDFNSYFKENNTNAFSPNGDGINDCFSPALQLAPPPYDRAFLECTDLFVYNRWGELVHSSVNDSEPCWDGTNLNGTDLPEGVYFYRFDAFGKERAGAVHLRREY